MKPLLAIITCMTLFSCSDSSETPVAGVDEDAPKYIRGIAAVDVYGNFKNKGFTLDEKINSDGCVYTCARVDGDNVFTVRTLGKNARSINKVEASVNFIEQDNNISQFIGYAASVPYEGANSAAATKWATDHFDSGGDTTIGNVRFVLTAAIPTARVLALYAH